MERRVRYSCWRAGRGTAGGEDGVQLVERRAGYSWWSGEEGGVQLVERRVRYSWWRGGRGTAGGEEGGVQLVERRGG